MKPDWTAPATLLADAEWVRARIGGAAKLYGCAAPDVLGTIWWYSLSSVLVAPAVESLAAAARPPAPAPEGRVTSSTPSSLSSVSSASSAPAAPAESAPSALADPSLDAMEIDLLADGRFLGARSTRPLAGGLPELGTAFGEALGTAIATIADVTGARPRALGAIATDSIGNRLLWTADPEHAMALAEPLVAAIGLDLPKPRFVRVGRTPAVRRASCCLIYEVGNPKCVSCPRQTPAERDARLRAALG
ncbi:(2Fe-2S)-binding protein [Amycolatopsis sp. NPDC098790]|uniref:(2Fe-2S)-binding protein n=1 Tax=Amycolatopsis sp. NPDC098790 TaxID=3363939 RepID=UPI00382796C6